jgi:SpoVK/Ycf46/Vps4 family AAA+-type ATPase
VKNWNLQGIVRLYNKKRINEVCKEASGAMPGSKLFLKHYKASLKIVSKSLPTEKLEEYMELAEKWNSEGTPIEERRR